MTYMFLFLAGCFTIIFTTLNAQFTADNAKKMGKLPTTLWALWHSTAVCGALLFMALMLPGANPLLFAAAAAAFFVSLSPLFFTFRSAAKRSTNEVMLTQHTTDWALANFDRLVEPGRDHISEESLRRVLREKFPNDDECRSVSYLLQNFEKIGQPVDREVRYSVSIDPNVRYAPDTRVVFGIGKTDLQKWPATVVAARRSWLPKTFTLTKSNEESR